MPCSICCGRHGVKHMYAQHVEGTCKRSVRACMWPANRCYAAFWIASHTPAMLCFALTTM